MKKFTDAIKDAWKKITHHHKGLPPTHTVSSIEEAAPNKLPSEAAVPVSATAEKEKHHHKHKSKHHNKDAVAPVATTTEKKKHHHKHKSKPRGKVAVAPVEVIEEVANSLKVTVNDALNDEAAASANVAINAQQAIDLPTASISKPRGKVTVTSVENADEESASSAVKIAEETPISAVVETAAKSEPAIKTDPITQLSAVVLMLGEKNEAKAQKVSELLAKRQSKELIYSGEGVDQYGLGGRLLSEKPHRLKVTPQGLHYLTTQEAVDQMNKGPRGKVAPPRI